MDHVFNMMEQYASNLEQEEEPSAKCRDAFGRWRRLEQVRLVPVITSNARLTE